MDLYVLRSQESRKVVFKKCFSVTLYSVLCTLCRAFGRYSAAWGKWELEYRLWREMGCALFNETSQGLQRRVDYFSWLALDFVERFCQNYVQWLIHMRSIKWGRWGPTEKSGKRSLAWVQNFNPRSFRNKVPLNFGRSKNDKMYNCGPRRKS